MLLHSVVEGKVGDEYVMFGKNIRPSSKEVINKYKA
jgi:hypothetical protein